MYKPSSYAQVGVFSRRNLRRSSAIIFTSGEVFFLINHERTEKRVHLPWQAREHLSGLDARELQLEPYGVANVVTHSN